MNPVFIVVFLAILVLLTVSFTSEDERYRESRDLVALRKIGHELLLRNGDRHSLVLPVKQVSPKEFLVQFSTPLEIYPDGLLDIMDAAVRAYRLPADYVVNVYRCDDRSLVYGFAIARDTAQNIVPCLGRQLPRNCYTINIRFATNLASDGSNKYYIGGGLAAIAVLSLFSIRSLRKKQGATGIRKEEGTVVEARGLSAETEQVSTVSVGAFVFNPDQQWLELNNQRTVLTGKEAQLLRLFAAAPNTVLERTDLQKQVWENEGVIVTRSLDMFVSRLRKKLEADPSIRLVNVHGKGYKMEIIPG